MSAGYSPHQEKQLHSILDKGLDVLRASFDKSQSSANASRAESPLGFREEPSSNIQTEVNLLQSKLEQLEQAMAKRNSEVIPLSRGSSRKSLRSNSSRKGSRKNSKILRDITDEENQLL